MSDNVGDPEIIFSRYNGMLTRDGITIEVNICRLADSKWSLEVVDRDNNSIVWDGEFDTEEDAYDELIRSIDEEGMDGILRDPKRLN
jgi:hypothetical protein